ncbi:MAG TPA: hypothetical protein VI796_00275 [Candidatus Thermoplasmatota archaeon]|nr:hypothetical protein [Candidatus Thermoplasmatota archaeon]
MDASPGQVAMSDGRHAFAVLSSMACILAGVWAMVSSEGGWFAAIGLSFIGKGLFVGPMLHYSGR